MKIITHKEKHYIQTEFGYREILATTDKSLKIYESENLAEASGFSLKTNDIYLPQLPESFIQAYIKAYNEGKQIETVDLEMEFTEMGGHNIGGGQIFGHWNKIKTRPDNTVVCHQSKMYSLEDMIKAYSCGYGDRDAKLNPFNGQPPKEWILENL